jgi:predicted ATPase
MVEWSYRLLSERARLVFDRASAFIGAFDSEASRTVLAHGTVTADDVPPALDELVRTSMIVANRHGDHVRYEMLETLRAYGAEQLVRSGEASEIQHRHAEYYATLATRLNTRWGSLAEADAVATFTLEWSNLRAAFHRCATTGVSDAITILTASAAFAFSAPRGSEHAAWARALVDYGPPLAVPIAFGWAALHAYYTHRDYRTAIDLGTAWTWPIPPHTSTSRCASAGSCSPQRGSATKPPRRRPALGWNA